MTLDEIREKIRQGAPDAEILPLLDAYVAEHPADDEGLVVRGMRHWSASRRSQAINDYLAALRINPESKAKEALAAANEILAFYHKDYYNP